ncbi:MAG: BamA/TamA family outer membrane protein [Gemmatimonadales bacterium]|nr:BamA/TamA family outer membrane protein [Gemmatimonadales bacterium]
MTGRPVRNGGQRGARSAACSRVLIAAVGLSLVPGVLPAQDADQARSDTVATPGSTLVPLPVLFYQPETEFGFGGLVSYYFWLTDPPAIGSGERFQPSSLSVIAIYTTRKQIITALAGELWLGDGRWRVLGDLGVTKFPTKFWGVGNDTPEEAEEDYTPLSFNSLVEVQRGIGSGLFLGGTLQIGYRELREVEQDGLLASGTIPGSDDGSVVGLGLLVSWDTRDNTVYPRSGWYNQVRAALYDGFFGSDYDFGRYVVDLRAYGAPLESHVVALRGLGVASSGTPPFDLMPELGGDRLLRGYFQGRYLDRQLLALQGEYRLPVWWRIGAVGFAAVGQVADRWGDFAFDGFHASVGGGIRFLISPEEGLNLRADYGWGFDVSSGGFYLSIGEAF